MCTVSFVPAGNSTCFLTSNRDESPQRGLATLPRRILHKQSVIVCPQDPLAHGSWIAAGENHRLTCLLNGAFTKHKRKLPYRISRGRVVLDSLTYDSAEAFASAYDFTDIEPFTMVMLNTVGPLLLHEMRWDGQAVHFKLMDENIWHLWSSVTLYTNEMLAAKQQLFGNYLNALQEISVHTLTGIHHNHFRYEDWVFPPDKVPDVATLSITAVACSPGKISMHYRDLVNTEIPVAALSV